MPARPDTSNRRSVLSVTVHDSPQVPSALADRWRELAVRAENPFALPEWHAAWLATHPGDAPFVLVCRQAGGDIIGVLALVVRRERGLRRLSVPGGQLADWLGPACDRADEAAVAEAVARALGAMKRRWDIWELDRCRADATWIAALGRAAPASGVVVLAHCGDDSLVAIDLGESGPGLVSGKKRREIDRLDRRMREQHEVVLRRSTTAEEVARDVDALLRLRRTQWEGGFDCGQEAFQRAFAGALVPTGLLRLRVLEVDGAPAAILYGWRLATRAFAYIQAFDRAYERHGVGVSLLVHGVRDSADEGCAWFDMLRGDERHKRFFHSSGEELVCHRAVRLRSLGRLEVEALVQARAAYRRLTPERRERLRRALRM